MRQKNKCAGRHVWKDKTVLTGTAVHMEEQTCDECGLKRRVVDGLAFPHRNRRTLKDVA